MIFRTVAETRTRPLDRREVQLRAGQEVEFLDTATKALTLRPERTNVAVSNAVVAGIAAANAFYGCRLYKAVKGDARDEAARLRG